MDSVRLVEVLLMLWGAVDGETGRQRAWDGWSVPGLLRILDRTMIPVQEMILELGARRGDV